MGGDPIKAGLVESMNRPAAMQTGDKLALLETGMSSVKRSERVYGVLSREGHVVSKSAGSEARS